MKRVNKATGPDRRERVVISQSKTGKYKPTSCTKAPISYAALCATSTKPRDYSKKQPVPFWNRLPGVTTRYKGVEFDPFKGLRG